jgi:hypothetical protein
MKAGVRKQAAGVRSKQGAVLVETSAVTKLRKLSQLAPMPSPVRMPYSDEWFTPPQIVKALGMFDIDPCAGPMDHARKNIRRPDCGLSVKWNGRVWLNPPYSDVNLWLDKMIAHGNGIALVNARCETNWWQNTVRHCNAVLFVKGRINFTVDGYTVKKRPTCGSCLVAFGEANALALKNSGIPGIFAASVLSVSPVVTDSMTPDPMTPDQFIPKRNPLRPTPEP